MVTHDDGHLKMNGVAQKVNMRAPPKLPVICKRKDKSMGNNSRVNSSLEQIENKAQIIKTILNSADM